MNTPLLNANQEISSEICIIGYDIREQNLQSFILDYDSLLNRFDDLYPSLPPEALEIDHPIHIANAFGFVVNDTEKKELKTYTFSAPVPLLICYPDPTVYNASVDNLNNNVKLVLDKELKENDANYKAELESTSQDHRRVKVPSRSSPFQKIKHFFHNLKR